MDLIINLFSLVIFISALFLLKRRESNSQIKNRFSIVIACRNEYEQLPALFSALDRLDYPEELFQIIIVDDASTDHSQSLI